VAVAVAGLLGRDLDPLLRTDLATLCQRAETEFVGAPTGGLDQLASLLTPADHALLIDFSDRSTRPVRLRLAAAGLSVLVTDTRVSHALADEAGGYAARRAECQRAAAALGVPSLRQAGPEDLDRLDDPALRARARHVVTENDRVEESVALVHAEDWPSLGRVLTASHRSLRDDFAVSCPELDTAVDRALDVGALGARMTGGGFGGSSIALVEDRRVDAVRRAVDGAFAGEGWTAPEHHVVRPAGCATVTN
jgi:galactokinase